MASLVARASIEWRHSLPSPIWPSCFGFRASETRLTKIIFGGQLINDLAWWYAQRRNGNRFEIRGKRFIRYASLMLNSYLVTHDKYNILLIHVTVGATNSRVYPRAHYYIYTHTFIAGTRVYEHEWGTPFFNTRKKKTYQIENQTLSYTRRYILTLNSPSHKVFICGHAGKICSLSSLHYMGALLHRLHAKHVKL